MANDIQPNSHYAIVTVKLALATICGDTAADGINQLLGDEIGQGFVADYAILNTDSPIIVESDDTPEEGELFANAGSWMVVIHQDVGSTDYHRVDTTMRLDVMSQEELVSVLSPLFEIEEGASIDVLKVESMTRHVL
jgi:hypothetical protein